MNELLSAAYLKADSIREESPDHDHLAGILYDLLSYFSEDGITSEQRDRLESMGFPELQRPVFS